MGIKQTARRLIADNTGVEAFVASEDGGRSYAFAANAWFHQADAEAVQRLADAEWGSAMALTPEGFDVPGVTEVLRFFTDPAVLSVIDYCSDNGQDVEFRVDREQAMEWLATHPTSVNARRVSKRIVAGGMKRWLEDVSVDMGAGGVINDEVMAEGQRRLDRVRDEKGVRWDDEADSPTQTSGPKSPAQMLEDVPAIAGVKPKAMVNDEGRLQFSAEEGDGLLDYYGEFEGGSPYIHPELEAWAASNGYFFEWVNSGVAAIYET